MSSPNLIIRKENRPERCEVCHQSDQFDPETQQCRRCSVASVQQLIETEKILLRQNLRYQTISGQPSNRSIAALFLGVTALLPGACISPIGLALGILGFIVGSREIEAIRQERSNREGELLAMAGYYLSVAGIIVTALLTVIHCAHWDE